jgi:hypothetical protein
MALWTTKATDTDRVKNYVVIKHKLRDVNGIIHGVKFRGGYAVIDKNTKRYSELRKLPLLKDTPEFPIEFLNKLTFISRSSDVNNIWGKDVYYHYVQAIAKVRAIENEEKKVVEEKLHIEEFNKCAAISKTTGELCKLEALEQSPSGYCKYHLLQDPRLPEVGVEVPKYMTKDDRKKFKAQVFKKLKIS